MKKKIKKLKNKSFFKNLSFKNVFFKYDNKDNYIIEDATFKIRKR